MFGCKSDKRSGDMAIITATINERIYIEVFATFLILSIENRICNQSFFSGW